MIKKYLGFSSTNNRIRERGEAKHWGDLEMWIGGNEELGKDQTLS
jgi:hypothetical protein